MARSKLVGLLFEAWKDLERVVDGLDLDESVRQFDGGSSYAWTYAHMGQSEDTWINVRLRNGEPHPYFSGERFRYGGTGVAEDWQAIREGVGEVRESIRSYLEDMEDEELERVAVKAGSSAGILSRLGDVDISLRYIILRMCVHHYYHIGEIATKRDMRKQRVGDYPGLLEQCV